MRQFVAGVAVGAIVAGGAGAWLVKRAEQAPVRWSPPAYYDDGDRYIHAQGSLIGDQMDGSTFLDTTCSDDKACMVTTLQAFALYHQVMLSTDSYRVTLWTADQVVAESEPPTTACNRVRMIIDRRVKIVHYYRIPIPTSDKVRCAAVYDTSKVYDWTLGDQPI